MRIEKLKRLFGKYFYPLTHAKAVLYGDGSTTVQDKLDKMSEAVGYEISTSNAVTVNDKYVLSASEKNPNVDGSLAKEINELNTNFTVVDNCEKIDSGTFKQTYEIVKDGVYLFITRMRVYGGTDLSVFYVGAQPIDSSNSDNFGGGMTGQYAWLDMTFMEYVKAGTHYRIFKSNDTTVPIANLRTRIIKLR